MDTPNKYILIVGIAIIAVGYFILFSPLLMAIGAIMIIADIACYIHYYFRKDKDMVEGTGCLCALLFAVLLVVSFFMGGNYKVATFGGKRHLYQDCQHMESSHIHDVHKMSALIWGCFDDCKSCSDRRQHEVAEMRQKLEEQQRQENLEFINRQISELFEVRDAILNGEEIDAEDYRFRYEVEDDIRDAALEDYREGYEPRGF